MVLTSHQNIIILHHLKATHLKESLILECVDESEKQTNKSEYIGFASVQQ